MTKPDGVETDATTDTPAVTVAEPKTAPIDLDAVAAAVKAADTPVVEEDVKPAETSETEAPTTSEVPPRKKRRVKRTVMVAVLALGALFAAFFIGQATASRPTAGEAGSHMTGLKDVLQEADHLRWIVATYKPNLGLDDGVYQKALDGDQQAIQQILDKGQAGLVFSTSLAACADMATIYNKMVAPLSLTQDDRSKLESDGLLAEYPESRCLKGNGGPGAFVPGVKPRQ